MRKPKYEFCNKNMESQYKQVRKKSTIEYIVWLASLTVSTFALMLMGRNDASCDWIMALDNSMKEQHERLEDFRRNADIEEI